MSAVNGPPSVARALMRGCFALAILLTHRLPAQTTEPADNAGRADKPGETHPPKVGGLQCAVTEVAPGVYRVRAGEPEKIVPSLVRAPANADALAAMTKIATPPPAASAIKVWRAARGCRVELPLDDGEVIYGLGLQCKHLVQNGRRRTLYTASGDNDGSGMSHAPVPFYVSTAGYGVLVDSARCLTFSVGEKQRLADANSLAAEGGKQKVVTDVAVLYGAEKRDKTCVYVDVPAAGGVDVYLFAGPKMGQAVARYNLFAGGGCMPSLAGLGPEYLIGTMLDSKAALETCKGFRKDRMPVTSVGMEPAWQSHAYSSSYQWNTREVPGGLCRGGPGSGLRLDALVPTLHRSFVAPDSVARQAVRRFRSLARLGARHGRPGGAGNLRRLSGEPIPPPRRGRLQTG